MAPETNVGTSSLVRTSIEEVQQVLEQTIPETPRYNQSETLEDDEEEEEQEPYFVSYCSALSSTSRLPLFFYH